MFERLRQRQEWLFFRALPRADRKLAYAWFAVIVAGGVVPAVLAIASGLLVSAVEAGDSLTLPLLLVGSSFVVLLVVTPLQEAVSANLGHRTAAYLYDRVTEGVLRPPGMGHLEDPSLTADLTLARDFDLGMTGPPLFISMNFIAMGLVLLLSGLVSALVLFGFNWWAPLLLAGAWLSTHYLLRESSVWQGRRTEEVKAAQRDADYAYRIAVDPPAAKELRLFGLADWTVGRFIERRTRLHRLQYHATRLRERPVAWCLLIVTAANGLVFWTLGSAAFNGDIGLGQAVVYAQVAFGTSTIAFGGLNWAMDGASAPVAAALRLERKMGPAGALRPGTRKADALPSSEIRFRDVQFTYPAGGDVVLDGFDLTIPAGSSLAIVGQNGAGKTTLAKLLCRLYDPQQGAIEIDGVDLRGFDIESWRMRLAAVFQDFIRYELPLRENVGMGAPDEAVIASLERAGGSDLASLDTVLAKGYPNGTDLSGGQWQRVALARALCRVEMGAGVVLLDEPTAQLDVRGEAEIFERILAATRHCTTILISHRFSTVRHADRICVVENGRVIELGTHAELMALGGRYHTMFNLQAQRFTEPEEEGVELDVLT